MHCKYVTLTGIDVWTNPNDILVLSETYPFVEWAILLSVTKEGTANRYPNFLWIKGLLEWMKDKPVNLSAHLCGKWVPEVLETGFDFVREYFVDWPRFGRNQLNLGRRKVVLDDTFLRSLQTAQVILGGQVDVSPEIYRQHNIVPLFDASGGKGIITDNWPAPIDGALCGYAGGLGPENLEEQLGAIGAVVGDREIWIDMESRIRDEKDHLDLQKCQKVLEIARPYVEFGNIRTK